MAHRKRTVQLHFMVTEHERELIRQKMTQLGTNNLGVYLRKMAIDGYIVKLELPELSELLSLLRRTSNNINQVARRVHETGNIYGTDLEDILQKQQELWDGVNEILSRLGGIPYMGSEPQKTEGERPEYELLSLRFSFSCRAATLQNREKAAKM